MMRQKLVLELPDRMSYVLLRCSERKQDTVLIPISHRHTKVLCKYSSCKFVFLSVEPPTLAVITVELLR